MPKEKWGPPPSDRAVIYTRVSTEQQEDGTSLAGQYAACLGKAKELGADVLKHYEETRSGGLYLSREGVQAAIRDIEEGRANILLVYKLDRTGRDVGDLRDIRQRVQAAGGRLIFADGLQFDKSPIGNLMFTQISAFAEFEREVIRERMVRGMIAQVEAGVQVARAYSPWGYHIVLHADVLRGLYEPGQEGKYHLVESESVWVKPVFERIAAGHSLRSTCTWLQECGAPTKKRMKPWNPAALLGILRNSVYCGRPYYRKTKQVIDERRAAMGLGIGIEQKRPQSEWIPLQAPALVTEELWQQVNDLLDRGRAERSGRGDRKHLLSGFVYCPLCGSRLNARMQPSTVRKPDGSRVVYKAHAYKCHNRRKANALADASCALPTFGGPKLDALVIEAITELLNRPEMITTALVNFRERVAADKSVGQVVVRMRNLKSEIHTLQRREMTAAESALMARENGSDGAAYEELRAKAEARRADAEKELSRLEREHADTQTVTGPDLGAIGEELKRALLSEDIDTPQKSLLLRQVIARVYPVLLPPNLYGSAAALRRKLNEEMQLGEGEEHFRNAEETLTQRAKLGGVEIVLNTGAGTQGPFYILSNVITSKTRYRDNSGRQGFKWHATISLRVERQNPFLYNPARPSQIDRELYHAIYDV